MLTDLICNDQNDLIMVTGGKSIFLKEGKKEAIVPQQLYTHVFRQAFGFTACHNIQVLGAVAEVVNDTSLDEEEEECIDSHLLQNFLSSNWHSMRFKSPNDEMNAGWRVEVRTMDVSHKLYTK